MTASRKFYELSWPERLEQIATRAKLTPADTSALSGAAGLTTAQADHMVENAIGTFALPLGVAQNFVLINGREALIPMAIEEPSVIAGASFMAKLAKAGGGFTAEADPPLMIGQMQILDCPDRSNAREALFAHREEILSEAAAVDPTLWSRRRTKGPGSTRDRGITHRSLLVLHIIVDVRDAMGANAVNTALERLSPRVEAITCGRVLLRILSNLADKRFARAPYASQPIRWHSRGLAGSRCGMGSFPPGLLRWPILTGRQPTIRAS